MKWGSMIIYILIFSIASLVIFSLLKKYVLSKLKVNKWIIFGGAILIIFAQSLLAAKIVNTIWSYIFMFLFVILFLWFLELSRIGVAVNSNKPKTVANVKLTKGKKNVKIRPKAKPNRVKNKE